MARFNTEGIEEIAEQFMLGGAKASKAVPLMIDAGAEVLIKAQTQEASTLNISGRSKGALMQSIKATSKKSTATGMYCDIYPHGVDKTHTRKGVRNADKAFVLEFGFRGYDANPWMSRAFEKSESAILTAQDKVWESVVTW